MKKGRKSLASLGINTPDIGIAKRIIAPIHLSDAEISIWNEVVNDQPAGAFTATHIPLLEMYCRHVVQGRILAEEILNFDKAWLADDDGLKRYDTLLKIAERESRAASSLATRLRITRQAIDQQTVARTLTSYSPERKPWQLTHEEEI
jgi:hypothetical protein